MISFKYIILIYIILILVQDKKYISWYPTIPIYPDSNKEALLVKQYISSNNLYYKDIFQITDRSISELFINYVEEDINELDYIITQPKVIFVIKSLKYLINRPRPKQIVPELEILHSNTADTPAYPSGHAFQAYYLSTILGRRYPQKKELFEKLAEECALSRVYAGLHYPSDNIFSKQLVDLLY